MNLSLFVIRFRKTIPIHLPLTNKTIIVKADRMGYQKTIRKEAYNEHKFHYTNTTAISNDLKFLETFRPNEMIVKQFNHWIILVRGHQDTLGACIVALKREIPNFGDMTPEEAAEMPLAFKWYEDVCGKLYGAVKFNYIAAMMRDNFVHFHAFPRYSSPINKYCLEWIDDRWPKVIQFAFKEVG